MTARDLHPHHVQVNCPRCSGPATIDRRAVAFFAPPEALRRMELARETKRLSTRVVMALYNVSRATAKRDIAAVRRFRAQAAA